MKWLRRLLGRYTDDERMEAFKNGYKFGEIAANKHRWESHRERVDELLEANNRLLVRAREAEAALRKIADGPKFALSEIGSDAVFMALNEAMKTAATALRVEA